MHKADVSVELPPEVESRLRNECPNLGAAVIEGFLINLFRRRLLSRSELAHSLGLDELAADLLLARHAVELPATQVDSAPLLDDPDAVPGPATQ